MFSSRKLGMSARPTGKYQIGSDLSVYGMHGTMSMNADGTVVALFSHDVSNEVSVFRWDGSSWSQVGSSITVVEQGDGVPGVGVERVSLSLDGSGSTLAVGAPTGLGTVDGQPYGLGRCYVYSWSGSNWSLKGSAILNPTASAPVGQAGNPSFGFGDYVSVSRDGNRLAVGAMDVQSGSPSPFVAVYDWTGSSWSLDRTIVGGSFVNTDWNYYGSPFSALTGKSVSLSSDGSSVAWGVRTSGGSGTAVVSSLPCPSCGPEESVFFQPDIILGSNSETSNPISVSLSGDGNTVAFANEGYVSSDVVVPPWVQVHRRSDSGWSKLGEPLFAGSVHLSHDGNVMVGSDGYVRHWDGSAWVQAAGISLYVGAGGVCRVSYDGTVVAQAAQVLGSYVCRVYRWN